jgi:hypothetical protein
MSRKLKAQLDASYLTNKKAEKKLANHGYTLDKKLSNRESKVFTDKQGNATIAYRGTQNIKDGKTDALIMMGMGKNTKRLNDTKKKAKKVEAKYGKANAVGHSLGGYLAENSGVKGNVVTYNKLALGGRNNNDNQTDVRTVSDIVSILTPQSKRNVGIVPRNITHLVNPLKSHDTSHLKNVNSKNERKIDDSFV